MAEVFKDGWRQAYPALALEKHDALHFQVSRFDSDWLTSHRSVFFGALWSFVGGIKNKAKI